MYMYNIIQTIILSIIIIYTCHYIFDYLKDTLTIQKTNNVIHKNNEKYQEILDIVKNNTIPESKKISSMKDELNSFLTENITNK